MAADPLRVEGSFRIAAGHPCLDGHFPGRPLVPGVVLLDEILAILRPHLPPGSLPDLAAVKFHGPVGPDCDVAVEIRLAGGRARFAGAVEGIRVVSGTASFAP